MIHALYRRNNPKSLWYLVSTSISAEVAKKDKEVSLKEAKKKGQPEAEAAIITYATKHFIPETLKEANDNEDKLYN